MTKFFGSVYIRKFAESREGLKCLQGNIEAMLWRSGGAVFLTGGRDAPCASPQVPIPRQLHSH